MNQAGFLQQILPAGGTLALIHRQIKTMPRQPRLDLPGLPHHITQRGVNRGAIFLDDDDRRHFRQLLRTKFAGHGIALHAYVFMDNHVHLLATPAGAGDLSLAMRDAGQNYVQSFNARHRRSGPLWQGRFKSCPVDSDAYLLAVLRYIELNPVRAAMVERPEHHPWSSVHVHLGRAHDPFLQPHPVYTGLAGDAVQRAAIYRRWLDAGVDDTDLASIRRHVAQERAYGDERFQRMVEITLNRPTACRPRGRPRKLAAG